MTTPRSAMEEVAPRLAELTADVLFGDVWERPGLSKRDRSLITVATLTALYRTDQLRGHIRRAEENRVTRDELAELKKKGTTAPLVENMTSLRDCFEAVGLSDMLADDARFAGVGTSLSS